MDRGATPPALARTATLFLFCLTDHQIQGASLVYWLAVAQHTSALKGFLTFST